MGIAERQARERETRRSAILGAARSLLIERGFSGTTTKEIAERCELSEATLFFYFKNKQEIFTSLLFEGIEFWTRRLDEIRTEKLPPRRRLARIWAFFQEVYREHPEYYYVSAHLARPRSMADVSDELRAEIVHRSGENFLQLADLLEGITTPGNARVAADLVWGSVLGLVSLRDARRNLGVHVHPTAGDFDRMLELLCRGLLPPARRRSR